MEPINELDLVVLTRDLPQYGLVHGDMGTAVHLHTATDFEVEFCSGDGTTVALLTLTAQDVLPRGVRDILHAREYSSPQVEKGVGSPTSETSTTAVPPRIRLTLPPPPDV